MLPQGRYEAICPQMCGHAPQIPTNGLDKPFLELRLVQRGLDKLASHYCASFFLSSGFKAKLGQNHSFETPWWPDSIYVVWCGSQHTEPTADPLPPHPTMSAFVFWHRCQFLRPPHSACSACVHRWVWVRGRRSWCAFAKTQSERSLSTGPAEHQGICKPVQSPT